MEPEAIALVHDLPGRMRFVVRDLKRARGFARVLEARVRGLPGVTAARANPLTGSLLVEHDNAPDRRNSILVALDAADRSKPAANAARGVAQAQEVLARAILEWLIERALRAAVTAAV